ncbi:MAG: tetratricopeptide repeat protein [Bacteroidales bacterium]
MKKIIILIITAFFFIAVATAQNQSYADSLFGVLEKATGVAKVDALNKISFYYLDRDSEKTLIYAKQAEQLAISGGYKKELISTYSNLGIYYNYKKNFTLSFSYYSKAIALAQLLKDDNLLARCYGNMGNMYSDKGEFEQAIKNLNNAFAIYSKRKDTLKMAIAEFGIGKVYNLQGSYSSALEHYLYVLKLIEHTGNYEIQAKCLLNISTIYSDLGDFKLTIEYLSKAIECFKKINDKRGLAGAYNNMGFAYHEKKEFTKALTCYKRSLILKQQLNDSSGIALVFDNIGTVLCSQGKFLQALKYCLHAVSISDKINDQYHLSNSLTHTGRVYAKLKEYYKAQEFINRSIRISEAIGYNENLLYAYSILSEIYAEQGNKIEAYNYLKKYSVLRDSIYDYKSLQKIENLKFKYETEKKEQDIQLLKKDKELQTSELLKNQETIKRKNTVFFFIISGFILAVIAVVIILNQRRKNEKIKMEKQLSDLEHKALQLQMNPHFIFNSLNSISNYIAKNETETARTYLAMFAKLMRQVLENSRAADVPLQKEIDTLKYYLELEKMQCDNKFEFYIDVDKKIDVDALTISPMLIQPFVENSVIHGIKPKKEKGRINIRFGLEDSYLLCEIEDDGVGRSNKTTEAGSSHKSYATQITQERLKIINKNEQFFIHYKDLNNLQANKTGTLVSFKLLYKQEL